MFLGRNRHVSGTSLIIPAMYPFFPALLIPTFCYCLCSYIQTKCVSWKSLLYSCVASSLLRNVFRNAYRTPSLYIWEHCIHSLLSHHWQGVCIPGLTPVYDFCLVNADLLLSPWVQSYKMRVAHIHWRLGSQWILPIRELHPRDLCNLIPATDMLWSLHSLWQVLRSAALKKLWVLPDGIWKIIPPCVQNFTIPGETLIFP